MAAITRIDAQFKTGNRSGAGTDGDIFIGIGGREFVADSAVDDFERGSDRIYVFGAGSGSGSTVNNPAFNNPSTPFQLDTSNLDRFPVYVRFEPTGRDDNWNLESVTVTVNPGPGQVQYQALGGSNNLWLGQHAGKVCHLQKLVFA